MFAAVDSIISVSAEVDSEVTEAEAYVSNFIAYSTMYIFP